MEPKVLNIDKNIFFVKLKDENVDEYFFKYYFYNTLTEKIN